MKKRKLIVAVVYLGLRLVGCQECPAQPSIPSRTTSSPDMSFWNRDVIERTAPPARKTIIAHSGPAGLAVITAVIETPIAKVIVQPHATNYLNCTVTNLPAGFGAADYATTPIKILASDNLTTWSNIGTLKTNGFRVAETNGHKFYRLLWDRTDTQ